MQVIKGMILSPRTIGVIVTSQNAKFLWGKERQGTRFQVSKSETHIHIHFN